MHGRPIGIRRLIQLMLILTLLTWATQTLLSQWGFGAGISIPSRDAAFVELEVRAQAALTGGNVTLKDLCRWSGRYDFFFSPLSETVVYSVSDEQETVSISVEQIKDALYSANVNPGLINFTGSASCTLQRTLDEKGQLAMLRWLEDREAEAVAQPELEFPAVSELEADPELAAEPTAQELPQEAQPAPQQEVTPASQPAPTEPQQPVRSLRGILLADVLSRLGLPEDEVQISFQSGQDVLDLSDAEVQFQIESPKRMRLGEVAWRVYIVEPSGTRSVKVTAKALAWQRQLVTTRLLLVGHIISESDLIERRVLVDQLNDEQVMSPPQAIGLSAAQTLAEGAALTPGLLEPATLARKNDIITVTLIVGENEIQTVARAMQSGASGEVIRARNEANGDVYSVLLNGLRSGAVQSIESEQDSGMVSLERE